MTIPNKAPTKGGRYHFDAIEDQLSEPGTYVLQFQVSPLLPGRRPLQLCAPIIVAAGPPQSFDIKVGLKFFWLTLTDALLRGLHRSAQPC